MRCGLKTALPLFLAGIFIASAIGGCVTRPAPTERRFDGPWDRGDLDAVLFAAENAPAEGLDNSAYDVAGLKAALAAADDEAAAAIASHMFARMAVDLSDGRTPRERRPRWFIETAPVESSAFTAAMEEALRTNHIGEVLAGFAPTHAQYRALKAALAATAPDDKEVRDRLRLNMERWRWMPRDLGSDYILVNVPTFELTVVKGGVAIDRRRIIAGAPKTPTPQFAAMATGVAFNPVWYVPPSIVAESVGALMKNEPESARRQGYFIGPDGGVRQKPGAKNSLGLMKLMMPNRHSVFLHDTPAKQLFKRDVRALSHGCIRVDGALDFAHVLLSPAWEKRAIEEVVATGSTVTVDFVRPIPVYVTYFTATADAHDVVSLHPDIYGFDELLLSGPQSEASVLAASVSLGSCPA